MGSYWHDTTSAAGPVTLASGHAAPRRRVLGRRAGLQPCRGRDGRARPPRRAARQTCFRRCFVGWNPPRRPLRRRGHNDAWMMASCSVRSRSPRPGRRGWQASPGRRGDDQVGSAALPCPCGSSRRGLGRKVDHRGLALGAVVIVAIATWRYGPRGSERRAARDEPRGGPRPVCDAEPGRGPARGGSGARVRPGLRRRLRLASARGLGGRARLALTAGLLLVCTSWLVPWYAVWAVPLAAVEEDRTARRSPGALRVSLRDAVPI